MLFTTLHMGLWRENPVSGDNQIHVLVEASLCTEPVARQFKNEKSKPVARKQRPS
jgi:hypothetical protein